MRQYGCNQLTSEAAHKFKLPEAFGGNHKAYLLEQSSKRMVPNNREKPHTT